MQGQSSAVRMQQLDNIYRIYSTINIYGPSSDPEYRLLLQLALNSKPFMAVHFKLL